MGRLRERVGAVDEVVDEVGLLCSSPRSRGKSSRSIRQSQVADVVELDLVGAGVQATLEQRARM